MSRKIELTTTYSLPVEAVHRTLTDENFWLRRVEKGAEYGLTLDHLTAGEGTIDVGLAQSFDKDKMPSMIGKIIKGDLSIVRGEVWGPLADGRADGSFTAVTTGMPVTVNGTAVLAESDGGCTVTVTGEVDVDIKLIGGTIEGMVAEQILGILGRDQEVVEEWVAANA
ncbi:DUF2505 domain-containing protein [Rhodococcus kronopolitis]|uniref:DUF2505 domain-containing protein n=1 Tax=Rhodococcus kronopolitis TaxID=1460226 RepID=A0ABV9FVF6_9NOCA